MKGDTNTRTKEMYNPERVLSSRNRISLVLLLKRIINLKPDQILIPFFLISALPAEIRI